MATAYELNLELVSYSRAFSIREIEEILRAQLKDWSNKNDGISIQLSKLEVVKVR